MDLFKQFISFLRKCYIINYTIKCKLEMKLIEAIKAFRAS